MVNFSSKLFPWFHFLNLLLLGKQHTCIRSIIWEVKESALYPKHKSQNFGWSWLWNGLSSWEVDVRVCLLVVSAGQQAALPHFHTLCHQQNLPVKYDDIENERKQNMTKWFKDSMKTQMKKVNFQMIFKFIQLTSSSFSSCFLFAGGKKEQRKSSLEILIVWLISTSLMKLWPESPHHCFRWEEEWRRPLGLFLQFAESNSETNLWDLFNTI